MRSLGKIYTTTFRKLTTKEKIIGILTFPLVYPYVFFRYRGWIE